MLDCLYDSGIEFIYTPPFCCNGGVNKKIEIYYVLLKLKNMTYIE